MKTLKSNTTSSVLCAAAFIFGMSQYAPAVEISGSMQLEAYGSSDFEGNDLIHDTDTDMDLAVTHRFNNRWSATVQMEAHGNDTKIWDFFDGAFVQYRYSDKFTVKLGDMSFVEGTFKYYGYDDEEKFAAGMRSHDVRGIEIYAYGLQLGAGFARGSNDENGSDGHGHETYDLHLAYQLDAGKQCFRIFGDYKSLQDKHLNEIHGGLDAKMLFGPASLHAVYGIHVDQLTESEPKAAHAILVEPEVKIGSFDIKGSALYTIVDSKKQPTVHGWDQDYYTLMSRKYEVPEYFFAYIEPSFIFNSALAIGIPVEYHTNSPVNYKDISYETIESGARVYLTPVENLNVTTMAKITVPIGDEDMEFNNSNDNTNFTFGAELTYSF